MNEVAVAGENGKGSVSSSETGKKETGALGKAEVFAYEETEPSSRAAFQHLQAINEEETSEHTFTASAISPEEVERECEIVSLKEALAKGATDTPKEGTKNREGVKQTPQPRRSATKTTPKAHSPFIPGMPRETGKTNFSSIFDMAAAKGQEQSRRNEGRPLSEQIREKDQKLGRAHSASPSLIDGKIETPESGRHDEREGHESDDQSQSQDQGEQEQREKERERLFATKNSSGKEKLGSKVTSIQASTKSKKSSSASAKEPEEMGNLFYRFMALMARILGQAEAEAHALYQKIKGRTDDIDLLTGLMQKINAEQGDIDWSEDEEMKALLQRARELGVDIPEDQTEWKEGEKHLLKENIQMRKDSMEKLTQLERTDMQRYLQEASQCHQARSNMLKLLKEVVDTIVHNIRP